MLKELIFAGIGATSILKEKVDEELNKLKEEGKIDSSDIKGFIDSLENKGKEQEDKFKELIKDNIKVVIDELNLATKEDLEKLKKDLK